ncbi:MAG: hypothetical protein N2045_00620 [Fimbriimonadales bacterium]|nr:hypothetical protein [Armatimonadota bacterium]MCX7686460.1 hypothetical protein [Fimbriimonadales bacterium]
MLPRWLSRELYTGSKVRPAHWLWTLMLLMLMLSVLPGTVFAQSECQRADVNGDGVVDDADLLSVLFCFGTEVGNPTIPQLNLDLRRGLMRAVPPRFPGAPNVPFGGADFAFVSTTMLGNDGDLHHAYAAWGTREDFANFPPPRIAQGLIVGAVYLPRGETPTGVPIQEGWHLVRMRGTSDLQNWQADLLDARTGAIIAEDLPVLAHLINIQLGRTWNDICVHHFREVRPDGSVWACTSIVLTYMCPNGVLLDRMEVWRLCRRVG